MPIRKSLLHSKAMRPLAASTKKESPGAGAAGPLAVLLMNCSVTAGSGAAAYFEGLERAEKAETILDDLLKAPQQKPESPDAEPEKVVVPASPREPEPDRAVLDDLLAAPASPGQAEKPEKETAPAREEDRPIVLPADAADEDARAAEEVLDDLLKSGRDEGSDQKKAGT